MDLGNMKMLLQSLLNKELEYLRKRFRPYKRTLFLRNEVVLDIKNSDEYILGFYENTKEKERQLKYTHKIYITENSIEDYKFCCDLKMKRRGIRRLRHTIRHELIHAFVFEEYEEWDTIKNCHGDYSPIFLGCLYWACGVSGHPYIKEFVNTDLCKQIKECKNYDEVQNKLLIYLFSLEKTVSEINRAIAPYKEIEICFNCYGPGIKKNTYLKQEVVSLEDSKLKECSVEMLKLGIGFLVNPDKLKESYEEKFNNGSLAKYHEVSKAYFIGDIKKNDVVVVSNIKS